MNVKDKRKTYRVHTLGCFSSKPNLPALAGSGSVHDSCYNRVGCIHPLKFRKQIDKFNLYATINLLYRQACSKCNDRRQNWNDH